MKCPDWLYRRIDERGRIPRWVRWIWPRAHWCEELDGLLIVDGDCCCALGQPSDDEPTEPGF